MHRARGNFFRRDARSVPHPESLGARDFSNPFSFIFLFLVFHVLADRDSRALNIGLHNATITPLDNGLYGSVYVVQHTHTRCAKIGVDVFENRFESKKKNTRKDKKKIKKHKSLKTISESFHTSALVNHSRCC